MTQLNRRFFLQLAGAAGLAPALPALPARAAATGGASTAQMLWASMHARAGSAAKFGQMAQSFGVSGQAASGVYATVGRSSVLATQAARLSRAPTRLSAGRLNEVAKPTSGGEPLRGRSLRRDLKRLLNEDVDDGPTAVDAPESDAGHPPLSERGDDLS